MYENIKISSENRKDIIKIKAGLSERAIDRSPILPLLNIYKLKKLLRFMKKEEKEYTLIISGITDVKKIVGKYQIIF